MLAKHIGFANLLLLSVFARCVTVFAADYPFDETEIKASDGSIRAKFVSLGATLTEVWVKDKEGNERDVVIGYDDNTLLKTDPEHPVFNAIVGRYAGRIKGAMFSIPISKDPNPASSSIYHITPDESGNVAIHGGKVGWDRREWKVVENLKTDTAVTYEHVDDADEGFPGTITVRAKFEVEDGGVMRTSVEATATEKTPIMVTQHNYWNLEAFKDGNENILDHQLTLKASKRIELDENAIPTGKLLDVASTYFDFREPRTFREKWSETAVGCPDCIYGYNDGYVLDEKTDTESVITLFSEKSGIKLDISTNQNAAILYTGWWLNTPRKVVHGGPSLKYGNSSAVAIEQSGYIDAINFPEFGQDHIYGPDRPYEWKSEYKFSVVGSGTASGKRSY